MANENDASDTRARRSDSLQVPPAVRLAKRIAAIINKLSESNMEVMIYDFEKIFAEFPRADVASALSAQLVRAVCEKPGSQDTLLLVFSAFLDCLRKLMGSDVVGPAVHEALKQWHETLTTLDGATAPERTMPARTATNLVGFVGYVYNFQIISCDIIYEMLRLMADKISIVQVDCAMRLLKVAGHQLRKSDTQVLKQVVELFNGAVGSAAARDAELTEFRVRFILETMEAMTHAKLRAATSSLLVSIADHPLCRFVAGFARKRNLCVPEELGPRLSDILSGEKWWMPGIRIGGTSASPSSAAADTSSITLANAIPNAAAMEARLAQSNDSANSDASATLLKLARKHGMNTDVRRAIFLLLMTSEDYLDAFEKLIKLGLKKEQEREIVRVIVHSTGLEKKFNRFYGLLGSHLCRFKHGFRVTFQYTLWDYVRNELSADSSARDKKWARKFSNLAALYAVILLRGGSMPANALNPLLESGGFGPVADFGRALLNAAAAEVRAGGCDGDAVAFLERFKLRYERLVARQRKRRRPQSDDDDDGDEEHDDSGDDDNEIGADASQ